MADAASPMPACGKQAVRCFVPVISFSLLLVGKKERKKERRSLLLSFATSETFALLPLLFDQTFADQAIKIRDGEREREKRREKREGAPSPGWCRTIILIIIIIVVVVVVVKRVDKGSMKRATAAAGAGVVQRQRQLLQDLPKE